MTAEVDGESYRRCCGAPTAATDCWQVRGARVSKVQSALAIGGLVFGATTAAAAQVHVAPAIGSGAADVVPCSGAARVSLVLDPSAADTTDVSSVLLFTAPSCGGLSYRLRLLGVHGKTLGLAMGTLARDGQADASLTQDSVGAGEITAVEVVVTGAAG